MERGFLFTLFRSVLTLIIFFVLHSLFQQYIFKPYFRPEPEIDYNQIASKLCPPGAEDCSFQLQENWKNLLKNSIQQ